MADFIVDNVIWFILIVVAAIIAFAFLMVSMDCRAYSRVTGIETRYEFGTCYVKQGDRFYPRDELKIRNATKGE